MNAKQKPKRKKILVGLLNAIDEITNERNRGRNQAITEYEQWILGRLEKIKKQSEIEADDTTVIDQLIWEVSNER